MPLWMMDLAVSPNHQFWVVEGLIVIGTLFLLITFLSGLKRYRLVRTIPTSKIRSATQGFIELKGRAIKMPGPDIIAPLSRQDCIWYDFRVLGHSRDQYFSMGVERGRSDSLFWIEDETGRCIIDPDEAKVEPSRVDRWFGDTQRPEIRGFGWMYDWFGRFHHRMEYLERRIHSGDELYVLGEFQSVDTERQQILNQDISAVLRSWKNDSARMKDFDRNKDGRLDNEEWEVARKMAEKIALQSRDERGAEDALHIFRKPDNKGLPYIISTRSENSIVLYYKLHAFIAAVLFVVFATVTMGVLWLRLNA